MALYCDSDSDSKDNENESGDEMPIAWGFLGVDGALATLHVEPEHRGKGLAVLLSKAVMRHGMAADGIFGAGTIQSGDTLAREQVGEWTHTEVAGYNKASRKVMEKIGGKVLTTVTWAVVELCD
jgi:GNAT superfamily N-acetyltransferase